MAIQKVAVIGAGTAGLCAAKHAIQNGFDVTVYEQTANIGGIWVYTDTIGKDEYGLPIHTSMYTGLRTNLPKEVMGYPDFRHQQEDKSYLTQEENLQFLQSYADHFKVREVIKLLHYVVRVCPIEENRWEVLVKDLVKNVVETHIYDAVLVCSGHFFTPNWPHFEGQDVFKGKQIHSHNYRRPEPFRDEEVLVIGAGPSGIDIVFAVSQTAKRVTFSHHKKDLNVYRADDGSGVKKTIFSDNVTIQGDVKRLTEDGVEFVDGTHQKFTVIFYCTGYIYTFPFLSTDCGIHVEDNFVQPLYKHSVNINHPTLAFIGIPYYVSTTEMFDIQSRFVLKFWSGGKPLPSKQEMLKDTDEEMKRRWSLGLRKRDAHLMGNLQADYFRQLSEAAEVENVWDVIPAVHKSARQHFMRDPLNYRKEVYKIVDHHNYTKHMKEE